MLSSSSDSLSGEGSPRGLQEVLSSARPLYVLPKDPLSKEVLIPALKVTSSLNLMMGYFSSASFAEIAPGLASFLSSTTASIHMVVSPFLTHTDFEILSRDEDGLVRLARRIFIEDVPSEDALAKHTLECLAWLILEKRLDIKIAVLREGLFHPKVWLFEDHDVRVALHGSSNFTKSALDRNREQLTLSRSWRGEEPLYHIDRLHEEFDDLWRGGDKDCKVVSLPEAVSKEIVKAYKTEIPPREDDFSKLWNKAHGIGFTVDEDIYPSLEIPKYLNYSTGDFSHQGEALDAWFSAGCHGILEMATGAGKTITSMICAAKLQEREGKLLVVVSAPYRPLIEQWCDEIREFGVKPINLSASGGPKNRDKEIKQAGRRLRMGHSFAEVFVVSNDTLCTEGFIKSLESVRAKKLYIADECHNLGAAGFSSNPPELFDFRLGLSATPVRQYDEEGTDNLIRFFGDICYAFTLEQAIGKCLTEYDYHVHFIELSDEEMEEWQELTAEISSHSWKFKAKVKDSYLDNLLRKRRLLLETADEKVSVLKRLLDENGPRSLQYCLVYATDKDPSQLESVNDLLKGFGVLFRQLTYEETGNRVLTQRILSSFQSGELQVLTAKRVLDEGVNIPQINTAFILASTTVKRQWVQRRGRLLRKCKAIGKTHAVLHDFVVLPPNTADGAAAELDKDARNLVRGELERVWEFAQLSRNRMKDGGPFEAVEHLQNLANEMVVD